MFAGPRNQGPSRQGLKLGKQDYANLKAGRKHEERQRRRKHELGNHRRQEIRKRIGAQHTIHSNLEGNRHQQRKRCCQHLQQKNQTQVRCIGSPLLHNPSKQGEIRVPLRLHCRKFPRRVELAPALQQVDSTGSVGAMPSVTTRIDQTRSPKAEIQRHSMSARNESASMARKLPALHAPEHRQEADLFLGPPRRIGATGPPIQE